MAQDPAYYRTYYAKNSERIRARAKVYNQRTKKQKREYDQNRRKLKGDEIRAYDRERRTDFDRQIVHMLHRAKGRSRRENVAFSITKDDISIPEFCPLLGIRLNFSTGSGGASDSPSLDRAIPALGYVKGNVCVMSMLANRIKFQATPEQIIKMAEWAKTVIESPQ